MFVLPKIIIFDSLLEISKWKVPNRMSEMIFLTKSSLESTFNKIVSFIMTII